MLVHNFFVHYFVIYLGILGKHFRVSFDCFFIWHRIPAFFPPFVTILVYNWDALDTKFVSLSIHWAIRWNSENSEPYNIDNRILLGRKGMCTVKKGNMFLLLKGLYANILSSIVMSKSKNVACPPWCSSFISNCLM